MCSSDLTLHRSLRVQTEGGEREIDRHRERERERDGERENITERERIRQTERERENTTERERERGSELYNRKESRQSENWENGLEEISVPE